MTFKVDTGTGTTGLAVENATVFEALDRFAAAQRLHVVGVAAPEEKRERDQESLKLVRVDRPIGATPVAYVGPSRLSVQGVVGMIIAEGEEPVPATVVFTAERPHVGDALATAWPDLADEHHLCVVFKWMVEPGFEDLSIVRLKVAAEDDAGRRFLVLPRYVWDPPDVICVELPLKANGSFRVKLSNPATDARAIGKIACSAEVAFPVERSEVEFALQDAGTAKRLGGCRIALVAVEESVTRFEFDGLPCSEFRQTDALDQIEIVAFGADGEAVESSRCGGTVTDTKATWWEKWDEPPARVVLRAVTKVAVRNVGFSFKDIPLPE
jgi:hypothetical protein